MGNSVASKPLGRTLGSGKLKAAEEELKKEQLPAPRKQIFWIFLDMEVQSSSNIVRLPEVTDMELHSYWKQRQADPLQWRVNEAAKIPSPRPGCHEVPVNPRCICLIRASIFCGQR